MATKQLTKKELLTFIKNNKQYLQMEYHVIEIGVFGSFARDEQNFESDIDLIVEFDDKVKNIHEQKLKLKEFFKECCHRETDIARKTYLKPRVKKQILKEAIYV